MKFGQQNLIGRKIGKLTVVTQNFYRGGSSTICECECGASIKLSATALMGRNSCGCTPSKGRTTHGMSRNCREFWVWWAMLRRTSNPNEKQFKDYGGRGITTCERWLKFENFYADMGQRPSASHSLERRDNNGNYCKENCRWATRKEQQNNRRGNHNITLNGITQSMAMWAEEVGIPASVICARLRWGWTVNDALTKGVKHRVLVNWLAVDWSLPTKLLAANLNVSRSTVQNARKVYGG